MLFQGWQCVRRPGRGFTGRAALPAGGQGSRAPGGPLWPPAWPLTAHRAQYSEALLTGQFFGGVALIGEPGGKRIGT